MYNENSDYADVMARKDYALARRQAFWRKLRHWLGHKCNDLLPTQKVFEHLSLKEFRDLGLQKVATEQIVGSSGRYRDFDLAFRPRRQETDDRWVTIARARYKGISLPPPRLYKVGDAYFVEDGNHRVSVARANGEEYIEAFVIALDSSSLIAKPSCTRLGFKVTDNSAEKEAVGFSPQAKQEFSR